MDASASDLEFVTTTVGETMMESSTVFVTALEEQIERSKSHWSELAEPVEGLSREEAIALKLDNDEVFKAWKSHPEWGFFFKRWDDFEELEVGEKFAEGAQAELYDVHVRWWNSRANERNVQKGYKWVWNPKWNEQDMEDGVKYVVKVFKEGTSLRDLQHQWPHGMFQFRAKIKQRSELGKSQRNRHMSEVMRAIVLKDGRFAFLMEKEDEDLRSLIDCRMLESGNGGIGPFSTVDAEEYMYDVALGVDELHRLNVVHRDLKASNVLVYTIARGYTYCIVSDYECSIGVVGTGWWRAPEILRACKEGNVRKKLELFSKAADIYSLGMTFYEILTGKHPFEGEEVTQDDVIEGQRPYVPEFVDEWAKQLLLRCWEANCDARPSIEDILGIFEANSRSKYIKYRLSQRLEELEEDNTSSHQ